MGIGRVGEKALVFYLVYKVGAIGENLILNTLEIVANHQSLKLAAKLVGQGAAFSKEFEAYVGNFAFVVLAIYYKIIFVCHFSRLYG